MRGRLDLDCRNERNEVRDLCIWLYHRIIHIALDSTTHFSPQDPAELVVVFRTSNRRCQLKRCIIRFRSWISQVSRQYVSELLSQYICIDHQQRRASVKGCVGSKQDRHRCSASARCKASALRASAQQHLITLALQGRLKSQAAKLWRKAKLISLSAYIIQGAISGKVPVDASKLHVDSV